MKKISIIALFCLIIAGCVEKSTADYYQLRNESGEDMRIKLYFGRDQTFRLDTLFIENNKYSLEYRRISGFLDEPMYIWTSDSADIYLNGVFKKRYRYDSSRYTKTIYAIDFYDKEIKNSKDLTVHIYTFLAEDFK